MKNASEFANALRRELAAGGSRARARRVQRFFREPVFAYGWSTPKVRVLARNARKRILAEGGMDLLIRVANELFRGKSIEENSLAVLLLEGSVRMFGDAEFEQFAKWILHVRRWDSCDALCLYLLGPLVADEPERVRWVRRWARSARRWHRRAALVSLVRLARQGRETKAILEVAGQLMSDDDLMVQKGVVWLLRETTKAKPGAVAGFLQTVRNKAPRFVLREGSAKLPVRQRRRLLKVTH